jgi:hypothetical protein
MVAGIEDYQIRQAPLRLDLFQRSLIGTGLSDIHFQRQYTSDMTGFFGIIRHLLQYFTSTPTDDDITALLCQP